MHSQTDYASTGTEPSVTSTKPPASIEPASTSSAAQITIPAAPAGSGARFELSGLDSDFDELDLLPQNLKPALSWATAAAAASNGIHYVKERFPSENIPFLPTPFRREPVTVEPEDKVVILDEVSEHAIRVKLLRTDQVGIIPMWNVEGPLEKLARQNMQLNEIVTSPTEEEPPSRFSLSHRRYSTDEEDDPTFPLTPTTPAAAFLTSSRRSYTHPPSPTSPSSAKSRKVGFSSDSKRRIFRYIQPRGQHDADFWDSDSDPEQDAVESVNATGNDAAEEDSKWWWDGWEESHDEDQDGDAGDDHDVVETWSSVPARKRVVLIVA